MEGAFFSIAQKKQQTQDNIFNFCNVYTTYLYAKMLSAKFAVLYYYYIYGIYDSSTLP